MTKNEAIRECKALWKKIKASELSKRKFLDIHPEYLQKWFKACPLCEYDEQHKKPRNRICCNTCPLQTQYHQDCVSLGFRLDTIPNATWLKAIAGLKEDTDEP